MLKNYIKIAFRNLFKNKVYSFINIFGLAVGIACGLMILMFVNDELLYDRFHPDADRIYRIALERSYPDRTSSYAAIPMPVGRTMVQDYPEVEAATQITKAFPMSVRYEDEIFNERNILYADSSFFDVFGIIPDTGNPEHLLREPQTILLTPKMVFKYFGDEEPIGKQLELDIGTFTVTGVVPPMPRNSHFNYDFIASLDLPWLNENSWTGLATSQYIKLVNNADPIALENKIPAMIEQYAGDQIQAELGISYDEFKAGGNGYNYFLQPIKNIHLMSNLEYELEPNGNILYVYMFSLIAVIILLIVGVNFINISTAQSIMRAREVGVRKTLGSSRQKLIYQFLVESLLISLLSLIIAIGLIDILLPFFNQLTAKALPANVLLEPWFFFSAVGITGMIGLAAGIYPAFILSGFKPVDALKGHVSDHFSQSTLRKGLVVFQFTLSIILLAGTAVVLQQIDYLFNKNLGFVKDQRLVIERTDALDDQQFSFMQELVNHTLVHQASRSNGLPGINFSGITLIPVDPPLTPITARYIFTDDTFLETFGIEMVMGREFSRERASDSLALIINETMANGLGWADPIEKRVTIPGDRRGSDVQYTIVGVMKDFHHESLHKPIGPVVLRHDQGPRFPLISLHLSTADVSETIGYIEEIWNDFLPNHPLSYFFYDQHYNQLYDAEIRTSKLLISFTSMSVLLTCMGLFGLSAYAITQRRKEIGIRKIHGASIARIISLLTKQYLKLVVVAFLIATPLAYFMMYVWLNDFAFRIDLGLMPFLLVGFIVLGIAFLTVSWQSVKAALLNPVESLRSE